MSAISRRIHRLHAVQVKGVVEVDIEPAASAGLVIIAGPNGAGKTSVLDSIKMAAAGARAVPDKPIRDGEDWAMVELDLGDLVVTRRWKTNGPGEVRVEGKDGSIKLRPQALLSGMAGPLSFDAHAFARMDRKKQFEVLRELVGIDLGPLDGRRIRLYKERADLHRSIGSYKGQLDGFPMDVGTAPDELVDIAALSREFQERITRNGSIEGYRSDVSRVRSEVDRARAALEKAELELKTLLDDSRNGADPEDLTEIQKRIEEADATNERVRQKRERQQFREELADLEVSAASLSDQIREVDDEKTLILESAPFPVPGLSFQDETVTYNGVPFDQCAESERLRVSVAMGLAMNPEFKVILIRDGSLLDLNSLKEVEDMALKAGAQIWVERVGEEGPVTVIIEDGRVKEDADAAAAVAE